MFPLFFLRKTFNHTANRRKSSLSDGLFFSILKNGFFTNFPAKQTLQESNRIYFNSPEVFGLENTGSKSSPVVFHFPKSETGILFEGGKAFTS